MESVTVLSLQLFHSRIQWYRKAAQPSLGIPIDTDVVNSDKFVELTYILVSFQNLDIMEASILTCEKLVIDFSVSLDSCQDQLTNFAYIKKIICSVFVYTFTEYTLAKKLEPILSTIVPSMHHIDLWKNISGEWTNL